MMFKLLLTGFAASVVSSTATTYDCQHACDITGECYNDPQHHGSYCKTWQDEQVCFGMYVRENGKLCFQPNDPTCDDATLKPLSCSWTTTTEAPPPAPATTTYAPVVTDSCQQKCDSVWACKNDPHSHGSYCKSWQDPAVCFGLYYRENGEMCFQPNDPTCNDAILKPVLCEDCETTAYTTEEPTTTTRAPCSHCDKTTTEAPVTTTTPCPPETTTTTEEPTTTTKKHCSECEKHTTTAPPPPVTTTPCPPETTAPPPPPTPCPEVDTCQQKCDSIESCRNDPHSHGSYCKSWQGPAVCFGLYYRENGTLCFEPNDPTCDDAVLTPVGCTEN